MTEGEVDPRGADPGSTALRFGDFRLLKSRRLLLEGTRPVPMSSRAMDILLALAEQPGRVVGKNDLMARAWPNSTVDDINLRVHVSALRRIIGDGPDGQPYLVTIPGLGYQFMGAVVSEPASSSSVADTPRARAPSFPLPLARIIGRGEVVARIRAQLPRLRFMTLVGPGGVGKTTVAITAADEIEQAYPDGVQWVDLATLDRDDRVPAAMAFALGLVNFSADPTPGVAASLRDQRMLLVLDSCERVVGGAARMAEHILREAPDVHILATSREPLRARGEHVVRLPPLGIPKDTIGLTVTQAMLYPAMQLFAERASAVSDGFTLTDANVALVARICSRVDGIALAIELAAGHLGTFDLRGLAAILDDRFRLMATGRRTALPRHQTMQATLEWSYETLPEQERRVLRRLAVFGGAVSLAAIRAIAADAKLDAEAVVASLARLVDKSIVTVEASDAEVRYRLLDITRAYAFEKLDASGERQAICRRHADYYRNICLEADARRSGLTTTEWLAPYLPEIDNVRAALDWAFSAEGDTVLAVTLSAAALPLLFELSLAEECRSRASQALAAMASGPFQDKGVRMRLLAARGAAQTYMPGPVPETYAAWESVLELATELADVSHAARALWGLLSADIYGGESARALLRAEEFRDCSAGLADTTKTLLGERMMGTALHFTGQQAAARSRLEGFIKRYERSVHRWDTFGSNVDHGLMAQATLARILWLKGRPDQALRLGKQCIEAVRSQGHPIPYCYALFEAAIPLAVWAADWDSALASLETLQDLAALNGLAIWQAGGHCFGLVIAATQGKPLVRECLEALAELQATGYKVHSPCLAGAIAEAAARDGDVAAGVALADKALADCQRSGNLWWTAELLRVRGELAALAPEAAGWTAAAQYLRQAINVARQQGALALELRATISVVRHRFDDSGTGELRGVLGSVLHRFTEGAGTADLMAAKRLLADLEN